MGGGIGSVFPYSLDGNRRSALVTQVTHLSTVCQRLLLISRLLTLTPCSYLEHLKVLINTLWVKPSFIPREHHPSD